MPTVLLIHGWGELPPRFDPLIAAAHKAHSNIRFVLPKAERRPYEMMNNRPIRLWYDFELREKVGGGHEAIAIVPTFMESVERIRLMILELVLEGVPPNEIILGGFSQGGCLLIVSMLLVNDVKVGGVIVFGGFIPVMDWAELWIENNPGPYLYANTPVLQLHGDRDPMVPYKRACEARDFMEAQGFRNWRFQTYASDEHEITPEMIQDAVAFIGAF